MNFERNAKEGLSLSLAVGADHVSLQRSEHVVARKQQDCAGGLLSTRTMLGLPADWLWRENIA